MHFLVNGTTSLVVLAQGVWLHGVFAGIVGKISRVLVVMDLGTEVPVAVPLINPPSCPICSSFSNSYNSSSNFSSSNSSSSLRR